MAPGLVLPPLVELASCGGDFSVYVEQLYSHFRADFIDSSPTFPGRRWAVKRHPIRDGKEATFWHVISEGEIEDERLPDLRRCERVRWPRPIIDAFSTGEVRWWPQTRKREQRLALATPDFDYLVILADRGSYIMLWTAYPIEQPHTRRRLRRECEAAERKRARLAGQKC